MADILTRSITEAWRSETTASERRTDLADLDQLLAELDDLEPGTGALD